MNLPGKIDVVDALKRLLAERECQRLCVDLNDTRAHPDFLIEVQQVLDGAGLMISAVDGCAFNQLRTRHGEVTRPGAGRSGFPRSQGLLRALRCAGAKEAV
jgi:hypothetical protein